MFLCSLVLIYQQVLLSNTTPRQTAICAAPNVAPISFICNKILKTINLSELFSKFARVLS